jgi:senataxin
LIPLRFGCTKCILVGDPKQLPPTTLSTYSSKYLYDQSIFQRLQKVSPDSISMLSIQYRMHPQISLFPSKIFYDGLLKDDSSMEISRIIEWQDTLPPFVFYNLRGREERNSAQSVFNNDEVSATLRIVRILVEKHPGIPFGHRIGIISFYKEQVKKLKHAFKREFGKDILTMVDINTVDGFQGQEKDVIILSCVRSSSSGNVGFLADRRRTNVALTRAKYSLVVVGDADTLSNDPIWQGLIKCAKDRQMYKSITLRDFKVFGGKCANLYSPGAQAISRIIDRSE